ncbi:MAG: tRNA preQ1(34) S-adenosylmethionine ribosyltransferase-isomerase QueA [Clostridiales bacterium]|jgi:S-adenosylmethionine:tRNA ribosyltransferase-isomerase|nr:tRNA preQ1(34) S-adenosylmethionine ribosyltransferase-isomerase QueA [Clostridiales bacterium]MDR2713302.1 tRNA preQ1(34) S-adenosylmethionine ribosyltransferase-isomerase QueA [Clostridiales bacterium]
MKVSDFDYFLPPELIAQEPIEPRDASRLLFLRRADGQIGHSRFFELPRLLRPGDVLVINDTRVLPARLYGRKESGAIIELLLLRQVGIKTWQALVKPGKKARPGVRLSFALPQLTAAVIAEAEEGSRLIEFFYEGEFYPLLEKLGEMPLPPYIKKPLEDQERYQPVYAFERGSAAAPTAGLHFTQELLAGLEAEGISIVKLLLHVGLGTFRPVKADQVEDHFMHQEYYRLSADAAGRINQAKEQGGRIIAVGTTSVRTLETVADEKGRLIAQEGRTQKYIYPGYRFKIVEGIITNFHLPKSTLLMLVSAFAGREQVLAAYEEAIRESYRFYSFGDAMLII